VGRGVWSRRLLLVVRVGGRWYRRAAWERRRGERRRRGGGGSLCELDVVRRGKAVAGALPDQRPVRVGDVVDVEDGVLLERELLVGLAVVVVERFGLRDGRGLYTLSMLAHGGAYGHRVPGTDTTRCAAYLFNVVVWNQALGLVLVLHAALLLRLPPVVVGRLLQHHQHVALAQGDLIVALGGVVVDGPVDA
jgi:hypothetical protein